VAPGGLPLWVISVVLIIEPRGWLIVLIVNPKRLYCAVLVHDIIYGIWQFKWEPINTGWIAACELCSLRTY
jgi:hypothetical protein